MKAFFDTSALIPVFCGDHPHHAASMATFLDFPKGQGCCAAHSVAEVYSVLTRLPLKPRISAEQAMLFVTTICERLILITLTREEYVATVEQAAEAGWVGGAIYDALIARCGLKAKAEAIYTWDVSDFRRLGPEVSRRVRTPYHPTA